MQTKIGLGFVVFALALIAISCARSLHADRAEEPAFAQRPYVSFGGHYSLITERQFVRITTAEQWQKLWDRHRGEDIPRNALGWSAIPQVDFDTCLVVAFFRGNAWNTNGEFVVEMADRHDAVRIRFDSSTFQTAGPDGGGVRVTPFGMWVIPRTGKAIVIEENVQGLIGREPKWKEQHRFEAMRHARVGTALRLAAQHAF